MRSTLRRSAALSALALAAALPSTAREEPVQITVGQPNIWSLEQAHYLLAQMHERSAALKAKLPGEDILDPAGLQGARFDLLRTAFSADFSFDEVTGIGNRLAIDEFQHETARRRQLQGQLDVARARQSTLVAEIADLEARRTAMAIGLPAGSTTPELKTLDATLAAKGAEKKAVDGQVTALTAELANAPEVPELTSSAPGTTGSLPTHGLAKFLSELTLPKPTLHPSVILDNFVQFQYEIIAKQLSLLRDELGEGERLVFLELPQAVYTVPGRADDYLVRTSWRIDDYCTYCDEQPDCIEPHRKESSEDVKDTIFSNREPRTTRNLLSCCQWSDPLPTRGYREVRVLDLIPRTLAVNLDATTARSKSIDLSLDAGTAGGIGAGLAYQRQQDLADRLVDQQVFAAGFGRGKSTFSWIFAPPPGARRIHPGDKTTYAVLAVPENALMIRLRAETCYFHRSRSPGTPFADSPELMARWWRSCTSGGEYPTGRQRPATRPDHEHNPFEYVLRIPGGREDQYYVEKIAYSGVAPGERLTVFLRGSRFSPQTGVLVNGTPLRRSLSIAQENGAAHPASTQPEGVFELVNSTAMMLTFSMPAGYTGTPQISLVSPGKSETINYFPSIEINGQPGPLDHYSKHHPMFRPAPNLTAVRLKSVTDDRVRLELLGSGFRRGVTVLVNGRRAGKLHFRTPARIEADLPAGERNAATWRIDYIDRSTQRHEEATLPVTNLLLPQVTELQVLRKDTRAKRLDVLFAVSGFDTVDRAYPLDLGDRSTANVQRRGAHRFFASIPFVEEPSVIEICGTASLPRAAPCTLARLPGRAAPSPQVHVVRPRSAAVGATGTAVLLRGAHLGPVEKVSFGAAEATIVDASDTEITVVAPTSDAPGPVRIRLVGQAQGKEINNDADLDALFTYEPAKK